MTILDLMEQARVIEEKRQAYIREKAERSVNPDKSRYKWLYLSSDDMLPDLREYPVLEDLGISLPIEPNRLSSVNFERLKKLTVYLKESTYPFTIHAPQLESINILIVRKDKGGFLPMLSPNAGEINLSGLPLLKKLVLQYVSDYKVVLPQIKALDSIGVHNSISFDFSELYQNTHIRSLSITGCNVAGTSFLPRFTQLEKLDLSYNMIVCADEVLQMSKLKELNLHRNPLKDPERYRMPQLDKVILNDHDKALYGFESLLGTVPHQAYLRFCSRRDPKRNPPAFFQLDNQKTDLELYSECFRNYIRCYIEDASSPGRFNKEVLSNDEIRIILNKVYPFDYGMKMPF